MNRYLDIVNSAGRPFCVEYVPPGARDAMLKFYDTKGCVTHSQDGVYAASYYVADLMDSEAGLGLNLNMDVDAWTIDARNLELILSWVVLLDEGLNALERSIH